MAARRAQGRNLLSA
ncbi:hypothetical protein ACC713_38170 [Rhizobium johnstonii]